MVQVSFIVPAYNEEKFLGKCLNSIFAEIALHPETNAEVIVVNNASTDTTHQVAASYSGVKIVEESRKGLVFARSTGALAARGTLFSHIDADCILPTGWLKTVLEEFKNDEKLVALSGPHVYYDISEIKRAGVKIFYGLVFLFHLLNRDVLRTGVQLQGANFTVRAWAWKKIGETSSDFSFYGEDTEIGRRLNKLGKVKFTFKLPIYTSGRRHIREGFFRVGTRYALNYFSVIFFKKPYTKKYKDIRPV